MLGCVAPVVSPVPDVIPPLTETTLAYRHRWLDEASMDFALAVLTGTDPDPPTLLPVERLGMTRDVYRVAQGRPAIALEREPTPDGGQRFRRRLHFDA